MYTNCRRQKIRSSLGNLIIEYVLIPPLRWMWRMLRQVWRKFIQVIDQCDQGEYVMMNAITHWFATPRGRSWLFKSGALYIVAIILYRNSNEVRRKWVMIKKIVASIATCEVATGWLFRMEFAMVLHNVWYQNLSAASMVAASYLQWKEMVDAYCSKQESIGIAAVIYLAVGCLVLWKNRASILMTKESDTDDHHVHTTQVDEGESECFYDCCQEEMGDFTFMPATSSSSGQDMFGQSN
jgi:hypothetical protein